jgi:hypothetical protein
MESQALGRRIRRGVLGNTFADFQQQPPALISISGE